MSGARRGDGDRAALERLLGTPETAWILDRVRARVRATAGSDEPLTGAVRLTDPSPAQRAAVVRLVGPARRSGRSASVDLAVLEEVLRRGPWPAGLGDAVTTLTGPVVDPRARRAEQDERWRRAQSGLDRVAGRFPGLARWWASWCAAGGLKRSARAEAARLGVPVEPEIGRTLVEELAVVLEALPSSAEPLAMLARRVLGDAHALDESRPLGRLAVTVVGAAIGAGSDAQAVDPGDLEEVSTRSARDTWASVGIVLSSVSSTVLCLGVPGAPEPPAPPPSSHTLARQASASATALEAMRAARTPLVLTLDQVRSGGVQPLAAGVAVHVCENPTVVEVAAARWAQRDATEEVGRPDAAPVLVCTSGQPSTAVVELLRRLTADGAVCRYHGDFDWPGLRIARTLRQRVAWTPWRYAARDYVAAVERSSISRPLTGPPADSPWDHALAVVMAEHGLAVEEEAVAHLLADDLLGSPEA